MNLKTLFLPLLASVAVAFGADEFESGPVIAKGKGVEVRRRDLDDAYISLSALLAARGKSIDASRREGVEAEVLDEIIVKRLLVKAATDADRAAAKTNSDAMVTEAWKRAESPEGLVRHLKSIGFTLTQFTNNAVERAICQEVVKRELLPTIKFSDDDLKKFYETNSDAFTDPEIARASHILISTRDMKSGLPFSAEEKMKRKEKAQQLVERARKGADFGKLADDNSDDPGVRENHGEYKFTHAKDDPRRAMPPEFEKALFALKPGDVSDVVTTDFGHHVIKLHEILPSKKMPYSEAQERIRQFLTNIELEKRSPAFFEKLKKDAAVEVTDERLNVAMTRLAEQRQRSAKPQ
jgi:peptidyl-prolyl cis-trans isomerase C